MDKLTSANKYIKENLEKTVSKPLYHFAPPIGWMNDPNGFSYFNDEYHLFYQFGPYDIFWKDIHWGHAVSDDMLNWRHMPVVMAPDTIADISGCFSGSAIEKDGELYLMYTGHTDPNMGFEPVESDIIQRQCLARYSENGAVEKCFSNPVIDEDELPDNYCRYDFRDPKVFRLGEKYYCVLAVRNEEKRGSILLYKSDDMVEWIFVGDIYRRDATDNTMFECPDLFRLGDKDVLVLSIMPCSSEYSDEIKNRVEYVVGRMDYEESQFHEENRGLLDYGSNYYAPQTTLDKNGNRVIIGWICDWSKANEEFVRNYGYNGIMTLPRIMELDSGRVVLKPVAEMKEHELLLRKADSLKLEGNVLFAGDEVNKHISLKINRLTEILSIILFKNETKQLSFTFDPDVNSVKLNSDYTINVDKSVSCDLSCLLNIEVFIDTHCVELYVNGMAFTFLCYDKDKGQEHYISSEGGQLIDEMAVSEIVNVSIH